MKITITYRDRKGTLGANTVPQATALNAARAIAADRLTIVHISAPHNGTPVVPSLYRITPNRALTFYAR